MHTYSFALPFPKDHEANADGGENGYLYFLESPVKLDAIQPGATQEIIIMHGATPAAPTLMTHSVGSAIGRDTEIEIQSDVLKITFTRDEFLQNPIPWSQMFCGEMCDTPIYYEFIED